MTTFRLDLSKLRSVEVLALEAEARGLRDGYLGERKRPDIAQIGSAILAAVESFPEPVDVELDMPADAAAFEAMMGKALGVVSDLRNDTTRTDAIRDVWAAVLVELAEIRDHRRGLERMAGGPVH